MGPVPWETTLAHRCGWAEEFGLEWAPMALIVTATVIGGSLRLRLGRGNKKSTGSR